MPPNPLCALHFRALAICMPPKQLCALHFKALAVCMPPKKLCALHFKGLAVCMPLKQLCASQWRHVYRRNQTGGNPPAGAQNPLGIQRMFGICPRDYNTNPPRDPEIFKKVLEGLQCKSP